MANQQDFFPISQPLRGVSPFGGVVSLLPASNPNYGRPGGADANRTWGGASQALSGSQVYGVKGGSFGLANAALLNKSMYGVTSTVQKGLVNSGLRAGPLNFVKGVNDPPPFQNAFTGYENRRTPRTKNNSSSLVPNAYFPKTDVWGQQFSASVRPGAPKNRQKLPYAGPVLPPKRSNMGQKANTQKLTSANSPFA